MRRVLPLLLLLSLGCPGSDRPEPSRVPPPESLDTSRLREATVLRPYSAPIRVQGYSGEATYQLAAGALPPGLVLHPGGTVDGSPTQLGTFSFEVLAVPERFEPIRGEARIDVVLGDTQLRLGIVRDRTTTLREESGLLWDLWVRVAAPRVEGEPDLTRAELRPGLFAAGPDGRFERGAGDDLLLVPLPAEEFTVTPGTFRDPAGVVGPCDEVGPDEPCAEGDPIRYEAGSFVAGADTGTLEVEILHEEHGLLRFDVLALPPDWCPFGEHYGGWRTRGSCE